MNASLLNPFAHDTPDSVEATLERASASCLRFNHVWDIETKGLLRWLEGHVKPVTALSWSPYSRYLASASLDSNLIIWDLASGHGIRQRTIRFDAPVVGVHFSPVSSKILLAVLDSQQVFIIDLRRKVRVRKLAGRTYDQAAAGSKHSGPIRTELKVPPIAKGEEEEGGSRRVAMKQTQITATRFSPDGQRVFAGTAKGAILVFDVHTCELIAQFKAFGSSTIRELAFDRAGRTLVINCNDRTIRILTVETRFQTATDDRPSSSVPNGTTHRARAVIEITPLHRFQDLVNRTPWNGIGFSGDGDYVFGGAAHKVAHNIYIWDRGAGALDKILEGPREPLIDVDWHPTRPLLASASTSGNISLWFTPVSEIWSAYAPGFEELEENLIYEEREDEFDLEDEEEVKRRKQDEEEALVDIWSLGPEGGAVRTSAVEDVRIGVGGERNDSEGSEVAGLKVEQGVGMDVDEQGQQQGSGAIKLEEDIDMHDALQPIANDGVANTTPNSTQPLPDLHGNTVPDDMSDAYVWIYEADDDCSSTFVIPVRLEDAVHELGADSDSDDDGRHR